MAVTSVNPYTSRINWNVYWTEPRRTFQLRGPHRGFEMKARVSREWSENYGGYSANNYSLTVLRERDLSVSNSGNRTGWWWEWLHGGDFQSGTAGFHVQPGNNSVTYCGGGSPYCFLEFNRGSAAWASVYQDNFDATQAVPQAGDNYTAEAVIRCPVGQPACRIRLVYWGLGRGSNEPRGTEDLTIPADGAWRHCRVDLNHFGTLAFQAPHDRLRWELYNLGEGNLDVNNAALAMPVERVAGTKGDPAPPPPIGNVCT